MSHLGQTEIIHLRNKEIRVLQPVFANSWSKAIQERIFLESLSRVLTTLSEIEVQLWVQQRRSSTTDLFSSSVSTISQPTQSSVKNLS